jgi:hypothetical protein
MVGLMFDQNFIYWAAGLLEGEGFLTLPARNPAVIGMNLTDEDVIKKLYEGFECLGTLSGPYQYNPDRKPFWKWYVCKREDVIRILLATAPLMGERRRIRWLEAAERIQKSLRGEKWFVGKTDRRRKPAIITSATGQGS